MKAKKERQEGYLTLWSDKLGGSPPVFIGWVARQENSILDLRARIQFGYPGKIELIALCGLTYKQADELLMKLSPSRIGDGNWFTRAPQVNVLLEKMYAYYDKQSREEEARLDPAERREARAKAKRRRARKALAKPSRSSRQRRVNSSRRKMAA